MLNEQTFSQLEYTLKMSTMSKVLREGFNNPSMHDMSCSEQVGIAVEAEIHARETKKKERLRRQSNIKIEACMEDINYSVSRGLDQRQIAQLATGQYIDLGQNITATGPTGIGKTFLSSAFGDAAIRQGRTVYSIRLARLFEEFDVARGVGTLRKYRTKLAKFDLLIIDDWGLAPINALLRHDLLELIDERANKGAMIITSQLPVDKWHDYLGEPTVADAILDRIVQRAHHIELKGESMRKADLPSVDGKEVT